MKNLREKGASNLREKVQAQYFTQVYAQYHQKKRVQGERISALLFCIHCRYEARLLEKSGQNDNPRVI
jgi:hypothetical protein